MGRVTRRSPAAVPGKRRVRDDHCVQLVEKRRNQVARNTGTHAALGGAGTPLTKFRLNLRLSSLYVIPLLIAPPTASHQEERSQVLNYAGLPQPY